jgi:Domain of unknown function (DUF4253)
MCRCAVVALLVCGVLAGGCNGSEPDDPSSGKADGTRAEARVLDELGLEATQSSGPLRFCDRSRVEVIQVKGEEAIDTWRELRAEASNTDLWPVLIGPPDQVASLADLVRFNCKDGFRFERTLMQAPKLEIDQALSKVARRYGVRARDLRGSTPLPDYPYSKDEFLTPLDVVTEEPLPELAIALLPIDASWQAPAILPWGHYNDNPPPPVHTAVLRDWSRRYGAELVAMTGEVIEMSVARPPTSDRAALALAREQFRYAPDIVQQGVGDVETLAAALKDAHAWYFWWD